MPRRSPLEFFAPEVGVAAAEGHAQLLRGWLTEAETRELLAIMDEDDVSLHGIILTAALVSLSRTLEAETLSCPALKVANDINLRQYCENGQAPKLGCYSSAYEAEYNVPEITQKSEFWKLAHELTVKHNQAKEAHTVSRNCP
jgi:hypothetical protein